MVKKNKYAVIIQARMGSTRLKGKVLIQIKNKSFLEILINRLKKSNKISKIIIATTNKHIDNKIINFCKKKNIDYFRGPEKNVLKRYYFAAKKFNVKNIIRITSDCPLADPVLIDNFVKKFEYKKNLHYLSNINPPTFPNGFDVEIFTFKILKYFYEQKLTDYEKEHVTIKMKNSKFEKVNVKNKKDLSKFRVTLDDKKDLFFFKKLFKFLNYDYNISFKKILNLIKTNPKLFNKDI